MCVSSENSSNRIKSHWSKPNEIRRGASSITIKWERKDSLKFRLIFVEGMIKSKKLIWTFDSTSESQEIQSEKKFFTNSPTTTNRSSLKIQLTLKENSDAKLKIFFVAPWSLKCWGFVLGFRLLNVFCGRNIKKLTRILFASNWNLAYLLATLKVRMSYDSLGILI